MICFIYFHYLTFLSVLSQTFNQSERKPLSKNKYFEVSKDPVNLSKAHSESCFGKMMSSEL